jgi:hypothetical protein
VTKAEELIAIAKQSYDLRSPRVFGQVKEGRRRSRRTTMMTTMTMMMMTRKTKRTKRTKRTTAGPSEIPQRSCLEWGL